MVPDQVVLDLNTSIRHLVSLTTVDNGQSFGIDIQGVGFDSSILFLKVTTALLVIHHYDNCFRTKYCSTNSLAGTCLEFGQGQHD